MPIHVYECTACGNTFEQIERINDCDNKPCPSCGKPAKLGVGLTAKPKFIRGCGGFHNPTN